MSQLLKIGLFTLNLAGFLLVSAIFLPILVIASYGTEWYEQWWERLMSS